MPPAGINTSEKRIYIKLFRIPDVAQNIASDVAELHFAKKYHVGFDISIQPKYVKIMVEQI